MKFYGSTLTRKHQSKDSKKIIFVHTEKYFSVAQYSPKPQLILILFFSGNNAARSLCETVLCGINLVFLPCKCLSNTVTEIRTLHY